MREQSVAKLKTLKIEEVLVSKIKIRIKLKNEEKICGKMKNIEK